MPKSLNPDDYSPQLEQIFTHIWEHRTLDIPGLPKREAESLRWDLYAYRKALKSVGAPRGEDYDLISFSITKVAGGGTGADSAEGATYTLSGQVGGPAWTRALGTIGAALEKAGTSAAAPPAQDSGRESKPQ